MTTNHRHHILTRAPNGWFYQGSCGGSQSPMSSMSPQSASHHMSPQPRPVSVNHDNIARSEWNAVDCTDSAISGKYHQYTINIPSMSVTSVFAYLWSEFSVCQTLSRWIDLFTFSDFFLFLKVSMVLLYLCLNSFFHRAV